MAVVKLHAEYLIPNLIWIAFAHLKFFFLLYNLVDLLNLLASVSEWERKKVLNARGKKKENRKLFHHKRSILKRERETKSFLSSAHPFEWILLMPLARERINFVSCLSNWWRNGSSISPSTSLQQLSGVLRDDGCDGGGSVKKRKIVNAKLSNKSWTAVSERWEKVRRNPKCTCDWSAACWKKVLKFT